MKNALILMSVISVVCLPVEGNLRLQHKLTLSSFITLKRPAFGRIPEESVWSMAFSPDGRSLAVAEGFRDTSTGPVMNIVVVDLDTLSSKFSSSISTAVIWGFSWSADGKALLVESFNGCWVFDLTRGSFCRTGEVASQEGGFISSRDFVIPRNAFSTTSLRLFDRECKPISDELTLPESAGSLTTSDINGSLAVANADSDIQILRTPDFHSVVSVPFSAGLIIRFLDNGRMLCGGPRPHQGDATFRCWSIAVNAVKLISAWPSTKSGTEPVASAHDVPVVAFMDTGFSYSPFTERRTYSFRRWIIWDGAIGRIIDQLPAKEQQIRFGDKSSHKFPYTSALSADGKQFAIGGAGSVEIYSLGL